MTTLETNIDGLVGPTHNYAGLSFGNVASEKYAHSASNPRQAALQGLQKMKFLHDMGVPQLVMPPQPRPAHNILNGLGFKTIADAPLELLAQIYSASSMWVANAATISPSSDTRDGKVHITPANLASKFHRFLEVPVTAHYLKQMFPGPHFVHHAPLPAHAHFADEGAANHMRLCKGHGKKGVEIFVYGGTTRKYPARQSADASAAIARLHQLNPKQTIFLQQHPGAIDKGVFHNDVIAMSNEHLLIYHEKAFEALGKQLGNDFTLVKISEKNLPLKDAVATYFFNSQLVTLPKGSMVALAPQECEDHPKARACFDRLVGQGHIAAVHYLNLRESMKNGGGPACLRLRIILSEEERRAVLRQLWLSDTLYGLLCRWIETHYRDRITPDDLRDPALAQESKRALAELEKLIKITVGAA